MPNSSPSRGGEVRISFFFFGGGGGFGHELKNKGKYTFSYCENREEIANNKMGG